MKFVQDFGQIMIKNSQSTRKNINDLGLTLPAVKIVLVIWEIPNFASFEINVFW